MTTPSIADLLKYADLQMAAEAFLTDLGGTPLSGQALKDSLSRGTRDQLSKHGIRRRRGAQLKFVQNASNLEVSVIGDTADKLILKNWYVSAASQIEEFRLGDGSKVVSSEVLGLLSAMAVFDAPSETMTTGRVTPGMSAMTLTKVQDIFAAAM